ncbi:MAG: hypothetical protein ACM3SY_21290 [Candidatus Omnitrophota bacterium]
MTRRGAGRHAGLPLQKKKKFNTLLTSPGNTNFWHGITNQTHGGSNFWDGITNQTHGGSNFWDGITNQTPGSSNFSHGSTDQVRWQHEL